MSILEMGLGGSTILFHDEEPSTTPNNEKSTTVVRTVNQDLFFYLRHKLVNNIDYFTSMIHFWKEVQSRRLLSYLEHSVDETLAVTAKRLLCAFKNPGTYESLVQLGQGLFGDQSIVLIESKHPAVLSINIKNANASFMKTLYKKLSKDIDYNHVLAIDKSDTSVIDNSHGHQKHFALAVVDFQEILARDMSSFFKKFLTPGRVLEDFSSDYAIIDSNDLREHNYTGPKICEF